MIERRTADELAGERALARARRDCHFWAALIPAAMQMFGGGGGGGGAGGGVAGPIIPSSAEATSGSSPVNVAINQPAARELMPELAKAGLYVVGGIIGIAILSRALGKR